MTVRRKKKTKKSSAAEVELEAAPADRPLIRIDRPLSLVAQVEKILREALAAGKFAEGRLPTEVELAEQLGVSRETVRRATETLQQEGMLVKYRRKGTFLAAPAMALAAEPEASTLIGYLQADYQVAGGEREDPAFKGVAWRMLAGAIDAAGEAGFELAAARAKPTQMGDALRRLHHGSRLSGVIFASFAEDKLVRQVIGSGLPTVLLDHDLHVPKAGSVRDDSFDGARLAVKHLVSLGHRCIAFAHWFRTDLNPWRLTGYRQGLRDAGLPRRRMWELAAELTPAGAVEVVEQLQKLPQAPTALLCFNNTLANLVIQELTKRGKRVPQDISVMGGGGEDAPGLACHDADWTNLGRKAVEMLLRAMKSPESVTPEHLLFPHTIRPGSTVAAPPKE